MADLLNPEQYARFQRAAKERFFAMVRELQRRNTEIDIDEAQRDVAAIVEEVRQERYKREWRAR